MGIHDGIVVAIASGSLMYMYGRSGLWGTKTIRPPRDQHFVTHEIYNMIFVTQYRFETDQGVTYEGYSVVPVEYRH